MAGYSATPLAKKLGIKENFKIKLINAPDYYLKLFSDMPKGIKYTDDWKSKKDFIHYFETSLQNLNNNIPKLKSELLPDGMIWISWYKKSAGIKTDVTEDTIRNFALKNGLVDIKVCAVSEIWSGLKLVVPVKLRVRK